MLFDCIFRAFFTKKNGENCSGCVKFILKCSEKFQEGTRPLRETFGNFRVCENDEKCKKSPNGTPWGVISKSVPGRKGLQNGGRNTFKQKVCKVCKTEDVIPSSKRFVKFVRFVKGL